VTQPKTNVSLVCGILLAVPLVYWPDLKDYTLGPKLMAWLTLLVVASAIAVAQKAPWPQNKLLLPAAAFGFFSVASTFLATDPVLAIPELLKLLAGLGTLVIIGGFRPIDVERCAECLVIASTLSAAIGCLQNFDAAPWPIPSAGLPSGTLGFRNIAAMVTIQTIPFAVWLVQRRGGYLWPGTLTILIAFLVQTRTRGAWLGIVAAGVVWVYLNRDDVAGRILGRWRLWAIISIVALAIGGPSSRINKVGPQSIDEKKAAVGDALGSILAEGGDRGRTVLWRQTLPMVVDHPLGVGLGNWKINYPLYDEGRSVTDYGAPSRPHNDLIWIASETGILGLVAFLWLLIAAWMRRRDARCNRDLIEAALASIVAITVHSCFSFPRDRATPTLLFWFALGVIAALSRTKPKRLSTIPLLSVQTAALAGSILICARMISFESNLHTATRAETGGDWDRVALATQEALHKGRFHSDALHLGGYALNTLRRRDEALAFYEKNAAYRPYDVQYLNGYAIALQNGGRLEEAIGVYRKARGLVATSRDLDYNLATLLILGRRPQEAEALLSPYAGASPPDPALLFHLGNARALQGKDRDAIQVLKRSIEAEPRLAQAWMVLGELYYRQNLPQEALEAFTRFAGLHPNDDRYRQRANKAIRELTTQLEGTSP